MDSKLIEALKVIKEFCTNVDECCTCKLHNKTDSCVPCGLQYDFPCNWDLSDLEKDGGE